MSDSNETKNRIAKIRAAAEAGAYDAGPPREAVSTLRELLGYRPPQDPMAALAELREQAEARNPATAMPAKKPPVKRVVLTYQGRAVPMLVGLHSDEECEKLLRSR